jgi:acyl-coenzyme A synthetase/AMP-(fatty) acid ligase
MLQHSTVSLWDALSTTVEACDPVIVGVESSFALRDLRAGSALGGRCCELEGRSVLIAIKDQLPAAAAILELDGVARRITLCPPDLPPEYLAPVAKSAEADAIVSDRPPFGVGTPESGPFVHCDGKIVPGNRAAVTRYETEWILLTSGTTGVPKLVLHTLASLAGSAESGRHEPNHVIWSTFYDIRRYGGLQIFLRAILTGSSLLLSSAHESTADFLARAGAHGVTHISGTPSHWRKALMSSAARLMTPEYIRLSGEIADQAILNHLGSVYPQARISHAFASTEAGVAFDVSDRIAGFPASVINHTPRVEMKVENSSLRIRSERTAFRYLGETSRPLKDADGFVDTGDALELRDDRYYFVGRRDGVINVGGRKVHPEEVEAVINRHPEVRMSLVRTRKNPITGALVIADVVLNTEPGSRNIDNRRIEQEILALCREELTSHKVPAIINFTAALAISETGKLIRHHA